MTVGSMMFFGGIGVVVIGVVAMLVCVHVFPRQRKGLLDKLGSE